MQVLKENVKDRIRESALKLFKEKGYEKVSMRQIAKEAEMTVGNIYRYYDNKDDLFEALLRPSVNAIEGLLRSDIIDRQSAKDFYEQSFDQMMIRMFLQIHSNHQDELYILVHGMKGSKMGNIVNEVTKLLSALLSRLIANSGVQGVNVDFIGQTIADNIIRNYITILYTFDNDEDREAHMLHMTRLFISHYLK